MSFIRPIFSRSDAPKTRGSAFISTTKEAHIALSTGSRMVVADASAPKTAVPPSELLAPSKMAHRTEFPGRFTHWLRPSSDRLGQASGHRAVRDRRLARVQFREWCR